MFTLFAAGAGAALAATAGAVALVGSAGSVAATPAPSRLQTTGTLTLTTRPVDAHWIDVGASGTSLGDTVVFSDLVSRDGREVGRDGGACQIVHVGGGLPAPGERAGNEDWVAKCGGTLDLSGGQITAEGLVGFTSAGLVRDESVAAITGGTGAYVGARGWLRVTPGSGGNRTVVLTLVR
ncbi:MAG: hypothetical protein JWN35_490 [Frankiales bacterium]|jgi:hypothetical protein|nr:hypothetical protein [Frankiales bacterium]